VTVGEIEPIRSADAGKDARRGGDSALAGREWTRSWATSVPHSEHDYGVQACSRKSYSAASSDGSAG
jgi:hypothetical protein